MLQQIGLSLLGLLILAAGAQAQAPPSGLDARWLGQLAQYPHLSEIAHTDEAVTDHEVGLDAIQKLGGVWQFKESERISGQRVARTWQVVDGFTSNEVLQQFEQIIAESDNTELLFACDGRDCGRGVQWANRVFGQRLLYGRDDRQHYRVYRVGDGGRLLLYSSARTADRQYLHGEIIEAVAATP